MNSFSWRTSGPSSSQRDVIRDFSGAGGDGDRIDLSYMDANATNAEGPDDAFTFLGTDAAFTGAAGQLTFALGVLEGDVNGDRVADFQIQVSNVIALAASDFLYL